MNAHASEQSSPPRLEQKGFELLGPPRGTLPRAPASVLLLVGLVTDARGGRLTPSLAVNQHSSIQSSGASALSPTSLILTFEVPGGRIGREPLETTKTLSPP
jgi:hypothetical protein